MIRNNYVTESYGCNGIFIENSSLTLEHNETKKNDVDGIFITSNSSIWENL